ncbi:helix-turn-helix transcriptional regulator [Kiloniella sp. EL199]|uniref:helix-turn-helix domain-containing protein n=1 Tax=Kiloniella sp. EL199 TaxID=2107581 RepID=UPI000EA2731F|nr:helix-turn-helix transcriptional regulator [Kiloniella sp. EL199]
MDDKSETLKIPETGLEPQKEIIVTLDVMLAKRKMRSNELATKVGITVQNLSLLKSGKVKGIRFNTLQKICEVLNCKPGDILDYG